MNVLGLFALIPTTLFLTISFFVLFTIRKIEERDLRAFGYLVAALLWLVALLFLYTGAYTAYTGKPQLPCMMHKMMPGHMQKMISGQMPQMMPGQSRGMMKCKGSSATQPEKK
jgi:hypothetical protein